MRIILAILWPLFVSSVPFSPLRAPSPPFVSGDAFRAYCDYAYDEEDLSLDPNTVRPYSTIFVKTDYLQSFFSELHPKIPSKYILVTHNSDYSTPGSFSGFLEDKKLVAWFAQNVTEKHPKLHPIPIGIANRRWPHGQGEKIKEMLSRHTAKNNLLYLNISVDTYPLERRPVYDLLHKAPYVYCPQKNKVFSDYLADIASCAFVASPRGNGLDTHRLWEALYLRSYPVVKSSSLDSMFAGLPVLIVQDWSEVNQELLERKYEEFKGGTFSIDKIYMSYWVSLIDSYKNCF